VPTKRPKRRFLRSSAKRPAKSQTKKKAIKPARNPITSLLRRVKTPDALDFGKGLSDDALFLKGRIQLKQKHFEKAIENFQESQKIRPGQIVTDALSECNKAKDLAEEMQKVDDNAALKIENINKQAEQAEQSKNANTLTNTDIISLTEKKLPTSLIMQKIKTSTCKFNTTTEALIELTNAGVSEEVILLMMEEN
jgi:tetratricopeptide (TPR) repeat protein